MFTAHRTTGAAGEPGASTNRCLSVAWATGSPNGGRIGEWVSDSPAAHTEREIMAIRTDDEREAVDEIVIACDRSVQTIRESWQLRTPTDCRVYILTSWPRCVFLGAPLSSQILLGVTFPFWYAEFKQRWYYSGGWSQGYGDRQVVGIKSPRLIAQIPDPIGESIFIKEDDLNQKVLSIVCHELTHAHSSYLQLPSRRRRACTQSRSWRPTP